MTGDIVDVRFLRHHWGDAYRITRQGSRYRAQRLDTLETLTASSADDLLAAIRDDYAQRPVPREGGSS